MKLTVRTRSMNEALFNKMRAFIPPHIEVIRHTLYDKPEDAVRFLHDVIEMTDGMLLVCDEDCFITDWGAVEDIARYISQNELSFAGIPDGGVIPHRCLSWVTANPFFCFFNCSIINEHKKHVTRESIDEFQYAPEMAIFKPEISTGPCNHNHFEPFDGLFYWLLTIGHHPVYLNAGDFPDGIATYVRGLNNENIAIHTWYSREYGASDAATMRIDNIYKLALNYIS